MAVRVHRTLELADDKFYGKIFTKKIPLFLLFKDFFPQFILILFVLVITCGKSGFGRDENSVVVLKFLENQRRVRETIYGREYQIKAELTQPNGTHGIKVKNCFAFNKKNATLQLINEKG